MLKVAIVNDTAIAIEALRRILVNAPNYQLLWVATTGAEAVRRCTVDCPDLMLMDMHMPELDGVEATRQIMRQHTCAILIVTATITSHSTKVFEALSYGALDVVRVPTLGADDSPITQAFLRKLTTLTRLRQTRTTVSPPRQSPVPANPVQSVLRSDLKSTPGSTPRFVPQATRQDAPRLIVIGASTGGPNALQKILSHLPKNFQAAIVVVQHIDEQFAPGLVQWLNQSSNLPVAIAQNGDAPQAGKVLMAGRNQHLQLRPNHRFRYTHHPSDTIHRPSVDVFFQSVANHWTSPGTAILLTGMGKDGAIGMGKLRATQWHTIAESAESCAIFGMPKAAISQGAARQVLALEQMIPQLIANFS